MPGTASDAVSPVCVQVRSNTGCAAAIRVSGPAAPASSTAVSPSEYRPVVASTVTMPRACSVFNRRQAVARLRLHARARAGTVAAVGTAAATASRRSMARSTDWIRAVVAAASLCSVTATTSSTSLAY